MSAEKAADDSHIDDLLDEDSMLGEEESDTGSDDNNGVADLIASPTSTIPPVSLSSPIKNQDSLKRSASSTNADQNGTSANGDGAPPSKKKIILNRQPVPEAAPQVLPVPQIATAESIASSKVTSEGNDPATEAGGEKAVIKLSEVTAAPTTDKLKLRQEKFKSEIPTTAESADKLKKRAERFGAVASGTGTATAPAAKATTEEDAAKLAKRQERFGIATAEKVDEMKQKRAARFGGGAKPAENSAEADEKKKVRAARFAAAL